MVLGLSVPLPHAPPRKAPQCSAYVSQQVAKTHHLQAPPPPRPQLPPDLDHWLFATAAITMRQGSRLQKGSYFPRRELEALSQLMGNPSTQPEVDLTCPPASGFSSYMVLQPLPGQQVGRRRAQGLDHGLGCFCFASRGWCPEPPNTRDLVQTTGAPAFGPGEQP